MMKSTITKMIKIANALDELHLTDEANQITEIANRLAYTDEYTHTMDVKIEHLHERQVEALTKLFETMQWCGGVGASRSVDVFIDGDGAFGPKITINGEKVYGKPSVLKTESSDGSIGLD